MNDTVEVVPAQLINEIEAQVNAEDTENEEQEQQEGRGEVELYPELLEMYNWVSIVPVIKTTMKVNRYR